MMLIGLAVDRDPQLVGQSEQQSAGVEQRIRQIRGHVILAECSQETAAEQRLAVSHLAHDLYEALAAFDRHQQNVERLLMRRAGEHERGVRRQSERWLTQAEVGSIHLRPRGRRPELAAQRGGGEFAGASRGGSLTSPRWIESIRSLESSIS